MRRVLLPFVLALLAVTGSAQADVRDEPDVARLLQAKGATLKWNAVPQGKTARYGHAEVLVDAPLAKVQTAATDYPRYKEFHHKFASARVVAKDGANTDLYLKVPIKVGPITIEQWEIIRFGAPATASTTMGLEGNGVKGDMKAAQLVITARALDDKHSLVKVDLLFAPSIPAPQSMVDEELRDSAQDFVNGIRDKAQGDNHLVTAL